MQPKNEKANAGRKRPSGIGVQATAVLLGGFLTGAMASLSMVSVPVFLDTNTTETATTQLVRQWARTYHYGHIILPGFCIGVCTLYGYSALVKRSKQESAFWNTVAALGTIAMVPFTWVAMTPTNDALFAINSSVGTTSLHAVRDLVVRWTFLHSARTLFPLLGAVLGFRGLLQDVAA